MSSTLKSLQVFSPNWVPARQLSLQRGRGDKTVLRAVQTSRVSGVLHKDSSLTGRPRYLCCESVLHPKTETVILCPGNSFVLPWLIRLENDCGFTASTTTFLWTCFLERAMLSQICSVLDVLGIYLSSRIEVFCNGRNQWCSLHVCRGYTVLIN